MGFMTKEKDPNYRRRTEHEYVLKSLTTTALLRLMPAGT